MELNQFVPPIIRRGWASYCSLNQRELMVFWAALGNIFGSTYGYIACKQRESTRTSDYMEVSLFRVPSREVKSFEAAWNDDSRSAQTQPGYEWTKMFKAVAWDQSPFQYAAVRMWGRQSYRDSWQGSRVKEWLSKNSGGPRAECKKFVTVVDDSVVRLIH